MIYPTLPDGKPAARKLESDGQVYFGSYKFTGKPGVEKIWIVWSSKEVAELESAGDRAFKDKDSLAKDPGNVVREFLLSQSTSETKSGTDTEPRQTIFSSNPELLVQLLKLEHR
jgi:hypothetical protein